MIQQIGGPSSDLPWPMWPVLKRLDDCHVWASPIDLLCHLSAISVEVKPLHVGEEDKFMLLFLEECTIDVPLDLVSLGFSWLSLSLTGAMGRREIRSQIYQFFVTTPVTEAVKEERALPAKELVVRDSVLRDKDFVVASQRAQMHCRQYTGIDRFDGVNLVEKYLKFRLDVMQVVEAVGTHQSVLVKIEIVLNYFSGEGLRVARKWLSDNPDFYEQANGISVFWEGMDLHYLNVDAERFVLQLLNKCMQQNHESIFEFVTRFRRISAMQRHDIPDDMMMVKFTSGISDPTALLARGIADTRVYVDFPTYITQFLSIYRSIAPAKPIEKSPVVSFNAAGTVERPCPTCGDPHPAESCTRHVKYPCLNCGDPGHFTRACPKPESQSKHKTTKPNKPHSHGKPPQGNYPQRSQGLKSNSLLRGQRDAPRDDSLPPALSLLREPSEAGVGNRVVACVSVSLVPDLVDYNTPTLTLELFNPRRPFAASVEVLSDTGAAANFMSLELAQHLRKSHVLNADNFHALTPPVEVNYGNGSREMVEMYAEVSCRDLQGEYMIKVMITQNCTPSFILGRPGLKKLDSIHRANPITTLSLECNNIVAPKKINPGVIIREGTPEKSYVREPSTSDFVSSRENFPKSGMRIPLVEIVNDSGQKRVMIRFPMMEECYIAPFRSPRRHRSLTDHAIIQSRLGSLQSEFKIERCMLRDCHVIHEMVLVDKLGGLKKPRIFPDAELDKRYRVTLDLRCINNLCLRRIGNQYGFFSNVTTDDSHDCFQGFQQFQAGALDILSNKFCGFPYYIKIDLRDAFQSILLPPSLRGLFCYEANGTFWRWTTLPQGWRWSPLFFTVAMTHVLSHLDLSTIDAAAVTAHYIDDILAAVSSYDRAVLVLESLTALLCEFGFEVNPAKCSISQDIQFCGFQINSRGITPCSRNKLTSTIVQESWKLIEAATLAKRRDLLRSWCGLFNYYRNFLSPQLQTCVAGLYRLTTQDATLDCFAGAKKHFFDVAGSIVRGLPHFPVGNLTNVICSLIVVDANSTAWSAVLLRVVRSSGSDIDSNVSPEMTLVVAEITKLLLLDFPIQVLPIQFAGTTFSVSVNRQSSTYRERLSQLLAVDKFVSFLVGPVYVVTDNSNCTKNWHHLDESLQYGGTMSQWVRFVSTVHTTLWLRRNSLSMSLVDYIARIIYSESTPKPIKTPSTAPSSVCLVAAVSMDIDNDPLDTPTKSYAHNSVRNPRRLFRPCEALVTLFINNFASDPSIYKGSKLLDIRSHLDHGIDNGSSNISRRFFVENNLLYHARVIGNPQVYVPLGARSTILFDFHDSKIGLHCGIERLFQSISEFFFWPAMHRDCLTYVKSCKACLPKLAYQPFRGDLSSIATRALIPFDSWVLDHCGPFVSDSPSAFKHVLVCVCLYSSFVVLIPTTDTGAETTVTALLERVVCQFGWFSQLYTDRGSAYVNNLVARMCARFGIRHQASCSYTPRVQGRAERCVRQIKDILKKHDGTDVWELLPFIQLYHNTHFVGSTTFTPSEIAFGTTLNVTPFMTELSDGGAYCEEGDPVMDRVALVRGTWSAYRSQAMDSSSDYFSSRSKAVTTFAPDDKVYRVFHVAGYQSTGTRLTGPHRVIFKISDQLYRVEDYTYPIPAFQLQRVIERVESIVPVTSQPTLPYSADLAVGDLFLYLVTEEDNNQALDLAQVVELRPDSVSAQIYWYDCKNKWQIWEDNVKNISRESIQHFGFSLTSTGRVPRSVYE